MLYELPPSSPGETNFVPQVAAVDLYLGMDNMAQHSMDKMLSLYCLNF
jgi:hypothetical protein